MKIRIAKSRQNTKISKKRKSQTILFASGPYRVIKGRLNTYQILKAFKSADQVLSYRPIDESSTKYFFSLDAAKRWIEEQQ